MTAPQYSTQQLTEQFMTLLLRGDCWPKDKNSNFYALAYSLMTIMQVMTSNAAMVLNQSRPDKVFNMIEEWNESLGLPDECLGANLTIAQQQAQILAKFLGTGGQNKAFYISYAALLGYTIQIEEFLPWLVGINRPGMPVPSSNAGNVWVVHVSTSGPAPILECEIKRIIPAQTTVLFSYPG
jgi:uncharacterized protein YmfQ (DUF2313 family)